VTLFNRDIAGALALRRMTVVQYLRPEILGFVLRVVWTPNVTYALNLAIRGLLRPGDRVVTTGIEHNAVMREPLEA